MSAHVGSATSRRRLRTELRQIRISKGYSLEDVRHRMEWSLSKVIRIEGGGVSISVNDLRMLLQFYGVTDVSQTESLLALARSSRQRHWAGEFREVATPAYMDFLAYEDDAERVTQFHPMVIPGLLQTEEYARMLVTATMVGPTEADALEARVGLRIARQRRFFAPGRESTARFILDEFMLDRSVDPEIMGNQIRHLLDRAEDPRVGIHIIPRELTIPRRFIGPFSMHEFSSLQDPDVVYLDNVPHDVALVEDDRVTSYKDVIVELLKECTSERETLRRLRKALDDLGQRPSQPGRPASTGPLATGAAPAERTRS